MAVTLTQPQLSAAMRLGQSPEENAEALRLLAYAKVTVERHAPDAPDAVHNEAAIRLAAYLYDQENAARGMGFASAIRNSGAASVLLTYRVHRAGSTGLNVEEGDGADALLLEREGQALPLED